ncbi:MAG TPA: hypothetical protein VM165_16465 [Planctomycetaceae bacterium]|nr:hypothetical protein [Planctomycetaceae bacterium]
MLKRSRTFVLALALCSLAASAIAADAPREPVRRDMELVYVFEGAAPTFLFRIGHAGFSSVESLMTHLETWPAGSQLTWAPGCMRLGGEPLSSEGELNAFRGFLAARRISFVLMPSG